MNHHAGECPVCKKPFTPGDDVVICPICGAPYHRECYLKEGKCVFTEKHKAGFEYTPPRSPHGPPPGEESYSGGGTDSASGRNGGVLCKNCQTVNDARNIFCEQCGASLHSNYNPGPGAGSTPGPDAGAPGGGYGSSPFGGFGGFGGAAYQQPPTDLSGELDGIPARDWAAFIGTSAPVYLSRMRSQDQRGSKLGIILTAFFFPCFYFAYRKMWLWAALALVLWLVTQTPGTLSMLMEAGSLFIPQLSAETLATLASVAWYLNVVRCILFGFFALTLYRRDAAKKISHLQQTCDGDAAYQAALHRKGAPSVIGAVGVLVLIFVVLCLVTWLGGDALYSYALAQIGLGG